MKIGVFDSGIGGLTVLKELINNKPNNHYIYIGDTKNVPYGNKSYEELLNLSIKIIDYFIKEKVDKIIIACGTVSSNLGAYLKLKYNIPIIDIISPTINYLNNSLYNNVAVIATYMTINSHVFSKSLKDKNVLEIACPKFVPIIENNQSDIKNILDEYLKEIKGKYEILVLGCTHYPIIKEEIKEYLGDIKLLNMATPILNMVEFGNSNSVIDIYFTYLNDNIKGNINKILNDIDYNLKVIKLN